MAKVLFTAVVAEMRNKLNGNVFSRNRYGSYLRTKVTPVNPATSIQVAQRVILAAVSQDWRELTNPQRAGWNEGSVNFPFTDIFGFSRIYSGNTLHQKMNMTLTGVGETSIDDCPSPQLMINPAIAAFDISVVGVQFDMEIDYASTNADFVLVVEATPPLSPGITFVKNLYRRVEAVALGATGIYNLFSPYNTKFGLSVANVGQKIWVRIYVVNKNSGQVSIASQSSVIIA